MSSMRAFLSLTLVATLVFAGCTFVLEVNDNAYRVSIRPVQPTTVFPATSTSAPDQPTPTPETALPSPTATTTPRPTPEKGACLVKVGSFAINERTAPSISAPKTPTSPIPAGSIIAVHKFLSREGYLWAQNAFGWFVVRSGDGWWVTFLADTLEWCLELPGYPTGVEPPEPIVGIPGVWAGPGANRDELLSFAQQLKPEPVAITIYREPNLARFLMSRPGWIVLYRSPSTDCPRTDLEPERSAKEFFAEAFSVQAHIIVLANECSWPSLDYVKTWIQTIAQEAQHYGIRAIVPIVWNPGAPPLDWVEYLAPIYHRSPIALLWGINVYPARIKTNLTTRDTYTQFTTFRYELYKEQLKVPIVVTEFARSDGSEPPEWEDIKIWWQTYKTEFFLATAWYTATPLGHWEKANLRGQLNKLAEAFKTGN